MQTSVKDGCEDIIIMIADTLLVFYHMTCHGMFGFSVSFS